MLKYNNKYILKHKNHYINTLLIHSIPFNQLNKIKYKNTNETEELISKNINKLIKFEFNSQYRDDSLQLIKYNELYNESKYFLLNYTNKNLNINTINKIIIIFLNIILDNLLKIIYYKYKNINYTIQISNEIIILDLKIKLFNNKLYTELSYKNDQLNNYINPHSNNENHNLNGIFHTKILNLIITNDNIDKYIKNKKLFIDKLITKGYTQYYIRKNSIHAPSYNRRIYYIDIIKLKSINNNYLKIKNLLKNISIKDKNNILNKLLNEIQIERLRMLKFEYFEENYQKINDNYILNILEDLDKQNIEITNNIHKNYLKYINKVNNKIRNYDLYKYNKSYIENNNNKNELLYDIDDKNTLYFVKQCNKLLDTNQNELKNKLNKLLNEFFDNTFMECSTFYNGNLNILNNINEKLINSIKTNHY